MSGKMINNNKGFLQVLGPFAAILVNIWFWVIVAVVILGFWLSAIFMLGKLIGAVIILLGFFGLMKGFVNVKYLIILILIGLLVMFNPFGWQTLSFMRM